MGPFSYRFKLSILFFNKSQKQVKFKKKKCCEQRAFLPSDLWAASTEKITSQTTTDEVKLCWTSHALCQWWHDVVYQTWSHLWQNCNMQAQKKKCNSAEETNILAPQLKDKETRCLHTVKDLFWSGDLKPTEIRE